jgi:hypothetical protein
MMQAKWTVLINLGVIATCWIPSPYIPLDIQTGAHVAPVVNHGTLHDWITA